MENYSFIMTEFFFFFIRNSPFVSTNVIISCKESTLYWNKFETQIFSVLMFVTFYRFDPLFNSWNCIITEPRWPRWMIAEVMGNEEEPVWLNDFFFFNSSGKPKLIVIELLVALLVVDAFIVLWTFQIDPFQIVHQ